MNGELPSPESRILNPESSHFKAQLLKCLDCGELFAWSADQQRFYALYGYEPPKRCPKCRAKKNIRRFRRW